VKVLDIDLRVSGIPLAFGDSPHRISDLSEATIEWRMFEPLVGKERKWTARLNVSAR